MDVKLVGSAAPVQCVDALFSRHAYDGFNGALLSLAPVPKFELR